MRRGYYYNYHQERATRNWWPTIFFCALLIGLGLIACCAADGELTRDELIDQIQAKVQEQSKELEFAERKAGEARDNSDRTHEKLGQAQEQAIQVGKERDHWHQYGDDQHDKWMNAEVRVAKEQAAVLRRNIVIGIMGLLIAVYVGLKLYLGKLMPF